MFTDGVEEIKLNRRIKDSIISAFFTNEESFEQSASPVYQAILTQYMLEDARSISADAIDVVLDFCKKYSGFGHKTAYHHGVNGYSCLQYYIMVNNDEGKDGYELIITIGHWQINRLVCVRGVQVKQLISSGEC